MPKTTTPPRGSGVPTQPVEVQPHPAAIARPSSQAPSALAILRIKDVREASADQVTHYRADAEQREHSGTTLTEKCAAMWAAGATARPVGQDA